jgi:hypothetical protein
MTRIRSILAVRNTVIGVFTAAVVMVAIRTSSQNRGQFGSLEKTGANVCPLADSALSQK